MKKGNKCKDDTFEFNRSVEKQAVKQLPNGTAFTGYQVAAKLARKPFGFDNAERTAKTGAVFKPSALNVPVALYSPYT